MVNIGYLFLFRLREKAQELWDWLRALEEEKYDHEQRINRQKYDVSILFYKLLSYLTKADDLVVIAYDSSCMLPIYNHYKAEASHQVSCPRTQQANLPV